MQLKMSPINKYQEFPDECFYCGTTGWAVGLEEHHLWRGNQRSLSPSVWLCHRCHHEATFEREFEIKLQTIYLYQYDKLRFKSGTIAGYGADKYNPKGYRRDGNDPGGCCNPRTSKELG